MYTVLVRQGDKYGSEYTEKLCKQLRLARQTPLILGDGSDANIPLKHNLKGWWSKLELFSPEMEKYRPLIYLDLDSIVLEPFHVQIPAKFTICSEWNAPGTDRVQSSFMILPKDTSEIWNEFLKNPPDFDSPEGDQGFLRQFDHYIVQELYPDLISSFKKHSKKFPVSKIVTFHGNPKQSHPDSGWAYKIWMNT